MFGKDCVPVDLEDGRLKLRSCCNMFLEKAKGDLET